MPSKPIISQLNIRAEATRIKGMGNPSMPGKPEDALPIIADVLVSIQENSNTVDQRFREILARLEAAGI